MPSSIGNVDKTLDLCFSLEQHQAPPQDVDRRARLAVPGEGLAIVNGVQVEFKSVSPAGFTSSFATHFTEEVARRSKIPLNVNEINNLLEQKDYLKNQAKLASNEIKNTTLNALPYSKEIIHSETWDYVNALTQHQKQDLSEAIESYQGSDGNNFFMNLAAMGFRSLPHFLQHLPPDEGKLSNDIDKFSEDFGHYYGNFSGMASKDEIEDIKMRLGNTLQEPSLLLKNVLNNAPKIDKVPLLKGAISEYDPVTTKLHGVEFLDAVLRGESINFNAFLSTTSSYDIAMQFCARTADGGMGEPEYIVDLTNDDTENETLRRTLKRDLDSNKCNSESILFYMKSDNCLGISLNSAKILLGGQPNRSDLEDEILLATGHNFRPEQIIKCKDGLIVIGSLKHGSQI